MRRRPKRRWLGRMVLDKTVTEPVQRDSAFTALELLLVIMVLAFFAAVLAPSLAGTRQTSRDVQCLLNHKQLVRAWLMYAGDNNDKVPNNGGIAEVTDSISRGRFDNWVNNIMTYSVSTSISDRSNTNVSWVKAGPLGQYKEASTEAYKCPWDTFLSPRQVAAGWSGRLRSVSMNSVFGLFSATDPTTSKEMNWGFPQYSQYLKTSRVPKPFKTWVLVDEHPDSINDGYFINSPTASSWQDIPGSYHDGGCVFSFADGHAELKKWQSKASIFPVRFNYGPVPTFDARGRADFAWYLARTGYRDQKSGALLFGY